MYLPAEVAFIRFLPDVGGTDVAETCKMCEEVKFGKD
jgi:hypothetical protein